MSSRRVASFLLCLAWAAPLAHGHGPVGAPVSSAEQMTKEEALALAFPDCDVKSSVLYLTEEQRARADRRAGFDVGTSVVQVYHATKDGRVVGSAWFDVHRVRTKSEVLMFVVDDEGHLRRLEVVAFLEPPDYQPRGSWYAQFLGRRLDDELALGRGIKAVTGATLTVQATIKAVRRVLAYHHVTQVDPDGSLEEDEQESEEAGEEPAKERG